MTPIPASLDSMDCAYAHANSFGDGSQGCAGFQQKPNQCDVALVKQRSPIAWTFVCPMGDSIINVFIFGPVSKIVRAVIKPVTINVADYGSFGTRTMKSFCNHAMDCFGFLRSVTRPFTERHGKVMSGGVRFSDKPLAIFDNSHTPKITNFISFMPIHWLPNFKGICHG